jgi:hypothetical protein
VVPTVPAKGPVVLPALDASRFIAVADIIPLGGKGILFTIT